MRRRAENPYKSPNEENSQGATSKFRFRILVVVPTFFAGSFALLNGVGNGIGNFLLDMQGLSNDPASALPWKYANYVTYVVAGVLWCIASFSFVRSRWIIGACLSGVAMVISAVAYSLWGLLG